MKKAVPFLFVILTISALHASAQKSSTTNTSDYITALGVKFYPTGVTLKHFLAGNKNAVEFIGYFYDEATRLTGL